MVSIKEIQELTRFATDTLDTVKGKAEQIFEDNPVVAEVIMMDGNLKAEVYKIYELLDAVRDTIGYLTAANLLNTTKPN